MLMAQPACVMGERVPRASLLRTGSHGCTRQPADGSGSAKGGPHSHSALGSIVPRPKLSLARRCAERRAPPVRCWRTGRSATTGTSPSMQAPTTRADAWRAPPPAGWPSLPPYLSAPSCSQRGQPNPAGALVSRGLWSAEGRPVVCRQASARCFIASCGPHAPAWWF